MMDARELEVLMDDVAAVMKSLVSNAVAPIMSRMEALERRLEELPTPQGIDEEALEARVSGKIAGELDELRKAVEAVPAMLETPDYSGMIATVVAAEVKRAVEALPTPQDGKSVTIDDVRPLIDDAVERAVAAIPAPRDGLDVKDMFRAEGGRLIAVMSDGTTRDLGVFVGKDADMDAIERRIDEKFAALPAPKDGLDGVGFDDMLFETREDGVYLAFEKDGMVKELHLPVPYDRGVYKDGTAYRKGNGVTWGGSFWIAQKDNPQGKPDAPGSDWRLAVKKGQPGKDAGK